MRGTEHRPIPAWAVAAVALGIAIGGAVIYAGVRMLALASHGRAVGNGRWILDAERALGLDVERGVQDLALGHAWVVQAANLVYVWGYWPILGATALALVLADARRAREFFLALAVSGGVGVVAFAAFPVAPPRLVGGFVDTIASSADIARPGALTNPYAAMPSFHVGWLVLAGASLGPPGGPTWRRVTAFLPAAVMVPAVVVTGNHYVVDAAAGAGLALLALAAARRWHPSAVTTPPAPTACSRARPSPPPPRHRPVAPRSRCARVGTAGARRRR